MSCFFFFQAEDGIRDYKVTGVQTCALPIYRLGNPLVSEVMIRKARHHQHNYGMPGTDVADFTDDLTSFMIGVAGRDRSEERRVGKEGRSRGAPDHLKKKKKKQEYNDSRQRR